MDTWMELDDAVCAFIFEKLRPRFSQVVRYLSLQTQLQQAGRTLKPCQINAMETMQADKLAIQLPEHMTDLLIEKHGDGDNLQREMSRLTKDAKDIIYHGTLLHIKEDGCCVVCLKRNPDDQQMFRCGYCRSMWARYCGRECQSADWASHKHFCADMSILAPC